jgi:hypothetical protein
MKKKLAIASIVVLVFAGCSVNDFSPEVVIPKAIGNIVKTKNKLYLSSNKKFLEEVFKKQDITEEEFNKLKELLSAAKVAKDYSTVKKIASFEPFKKRVELEKSINKLLSTDYSRIKLYVWKNVSERGFLAMPKEVPNDAILKKIDIDLINTYNDYLNLAKKYKMNSLVKKLNSYKNKVKTEYLIGLNKVYKYLIITNFKDVSSDKILNLSNKLFKIGEKTEARNLLFNYANSKLKKDINFDISKICNSLKEFGFSDFAKKLNKKRLALQTQKEKRRKLISLVKEKKSSSSQKQKQTYSVKELSSLINKMKNQYIPNYCLGINKKIKLEKKNAFGNIETMTVPLNFYIKMQKIINKPEFDADIERAKFYAFCLKNTLKNTDSKYWIMYDEIYYDVVGYLQGMAYSGLLPTTFNVNVTNVAGKHFKINTNVGINYLAKGLILYLKGNKVDVPYKMMLIYAYLYTNTKGQLINETNFFLKCYTNYIGKRFVTNIVKIIANNSSNPKIAILAYKLSKNDINNLTEWFLKDKKVARIFKIMKQSYNSNNGCY